MINIIFLLFFVSLAVVHASYKIYSNTVTVTTSEYTLSLIVNNTNPVLYHNIVFSGQLTLDGEGVPSGIIELYVSPDNVNWNLLISNVTDSNGFYSITYNVAEAGTFHYRTGFDVP